MLDLPEDVWIVNRQSGKPVKARLVTLTRDLAAKQIDGNWWNLSVSKSVRLEEGDHHWPWRKLVGLNHNNLNWESLAIQSSGGLVEGAITYRIDAKSQLSPGNGAVYVDRLATAPRNRTWLVEHPLYKGVGSILLLAAVRHSYLLGLGGRIWLTSLPTERTREFYSRQGFQVIFEESDGTIDFELPDIEAERWLKHKGYL